MDTQVCSGDEEVIASASAARCSPRRTRSKKRRRRTAPRDAGDMDCSAKEGPTFRLFRTFQEVWEDSLTWEEIRARKLRPWGDRASEEPPPPVLFSSQSSSSVSTPSLVPSATSSGGSVPVSVITSASTQEASQSMDLSDQPGLETHLRPFRHR